jgi:hypothetical protein
MRGIEKPQFYYRYVLKMILKEQKVHCANIGTFSPFPYINLLKKKLKASKQISKKS